MMKLTHSATARVTAVLLASVVMTPVYTPSATAQDVTDAQITTALEHEYLRDTAVPLRSVTVHTQAGVVTLTGEVNTLMARQQAVSLASVVKGVRSVVNRIRLAPTRRTPEQLRNDIAAALRADAVAERFEIGIDTDSMNTVTLRGQVDSWAEQRHVETVAMTVPGVMAVTNLLEVGDPATRRGELEIAEEIRARLRWDARVDDSLVNVLVADGNRVMLSGTVGSLAEKLHTERLAWIAGVRDVLATQLEVRYWARNEALSRDKYAAKRDEDIRGAVETALRYDPRVLRSNIEVDVRNGSAQLSGTVDSLDAKRAVEQNAHNTVGVRHVRNELEVRPGIRDDAAIETLISNALHGYGLTESDDIEVAVEDGRVQLTGDVDSAYAHWRLEHTAAAVRGVTDVTNLLTIDGQPAVLLSRIYGFYPEPDRLRAHTPDGLASDREIHDEVRSEMFWSPFVDSDDVDIEVDNGVVTLSGEVGSAREYQAARENAFEGGALAVHNRIDIAS